MRDRFGEDQSVLPGESVLTASASFYLTLTMRSVLVRLFLIALLFPLIAAANDPWEAIAPEDLAATTSKVGADIEMIHVRMVLDGGGGSSYAEKSVEAKVFTKKGVENVSILHITYPKRDKIWDVAARVVKPDGTSIELTKKDFIESTAEKTKDMDVREMSFAFRGLAPGDIVQYRYRTSQVKSKWTIATQWYYCQEEVPVRLYELSVLRSASDLQVLPFNCPNIEVKNRNKSEILVKVKDMPAFVKEPHMPPERDFRSWICLIYTEKIMRLYSTKDAWETIGSQTAEQFKFDIAANEEMRAKARELTADAKTPEEKLARLSAYCQSDYTNFEWVKNAETMEDRKKREEAEDTQPAKVTFKKRDGNDVDINRLFAALARSLKFDVRMAENASRDDLTNIRSAQGYVFLNRYSVAVKVGDKWSFYTPSDYLGQPGLLGTQDEGALMFVCDEDKSWFQTSAVASADKTLIERTGTFSLDSDGTLEGDVEVKMNGHAGVQMKEKWWGEPDSLKQLQDEVTNRVSGAEITDFKVTNLRSFAMPVSLSYHIKVAGYAETTGTKLILAPDFFEVGRVSPFTAETRLHPIMFEYASTTRDNVTVTLPEGYKLDAPSAPRNVGRPDEIINAQYKVLFHPKTHSLTFHRTKIIGSDGSTIFQKESYPIIKRLFEAMDQSDHHNFILKPAEEVASAANSAPASAVKK